MKKNFIIVFLLIACGASAQNNVPGEYAEKYVGHVVSTYGYVYKIHKDPHTKAMHISFGSKTLSKGVILTMTNDRKLDMGTTFQDLAGRFINVTGKITKVKGKIFIDGDDPLTHIYVRQPGLALN